jgi:hypothetical protein
MIPLKSTAADGGDPNCYYEYHHGRGAHVLVKPDPDVNRPKYSTSCVCQNCCDFLIFVGCIAFLYFAITFALSLLEDNDGGN